MHAGQLIPAYINPGTLMHMQKLMLWTSDLNKASLPVSFLPNAVHTEERGLVTHDRIELSCSQLPFKPPFLFSILHSESDTIVWGTVAFN